MFKYIVKRIIATFPVVVVVAVVVFSLIHLSPGDPAAIIAGDDATAEQIRDMRSRLGLDLPLHEQFVSWCYRVLRGDLGVSVFSNMPVAQLISHRIGPTLALTIATMFVAIAIAVPLGTLAAWKVGSWIDRAVMALAVAGFSFPGFLIAYILIYIFAVKLGWLPVQGYSPPSDGIVPFIRGLALPTLTLSIGYMALIARITRAAMIDTLSEDYIRTAAAKGVSSTTILFRHALKNAAVPIVTVIGVGVGMLISGVVVTETVFAIPGLGRLIVDAILHRDYAVIQGVMLLFSLTYVFVNLVVDISYTLLDPRIRY